MTTTSSLITPLPPGLTDTVEGRAAVGGIGHGQRIGNGAGRSAQRRAEIIAVRTDICSW
jgi:hypothetical protein